MNSDTKHRNSKPPLEGLRVIDLAGEKGAFCTKLFADLGADVIKVEKPGGDATRNIGPFANDDPHQEKSLYFAYNNTNKRSVTLNLETVDGREIFEKLVNRSDVVVESYNPGYLAKLGLDYSTLSRFNPGLVMVSITGFGQTGPYRDFKSPDIVTYAMGGLMYLTGDQDMPPLLAGGLQCCYLVSLFAAGAAMVALQARAAIGKGQHVDISVQECVASILEVMYHYLYDGRIPKRFGARHHEACPGDNYPCKDGQWSICVGPHSHVWVRFIAWLINEGIDVGEFSGKEYEDGNKRRTVIDTKLNPLIRGWAMSHTKAEIFEIGQKNDVAVAPVSTIDEVVKDPHLLARDFFQAVSHPTIGTANYPGMPLKCLGVAVTIRPAPLLGEHNQEVYGELGFSKEDLLILKEMGAI